MLSNGDVMENLEPFKMMITAPDVSDVLPIIN